MYRQHRMKWIVPLLLMTFMIGIAAGCAGKPNASGDTGAAPKQEPTAQERTVKHLLGETVIKGEPSKIVSLHPWLTDFMLSMGLTPVAAPSSGPNSNKFSWYLEDKLTATKNIGWQIPQVNLESVLAAEPDLIVANQNHEKVYGQLSQIAPTIAIEPLKDDKGNRKMRETFLAFAQMLNKEAQAKRAIAGYDEHAKQAKEQVKQKIGNQTVMFLRVTDKDLRYYSPALFEVLYSDLALTPPPSIPDSSKSYEALSIEKLPEINPDHIFLLVENQDKVTEIEQLSLWKQLNAVKNGHVYKVDYDLWFQGFGPIANEKMLDDVVKKLVQ
ncbi:ABC transporter substrate-binding protein [Paenibacillus doosanensis]|uniref:ABC transporter substrate-binding protein n=1 Tax=Paenibacillus doosanensis TaxID=1229154 RepID=UPI00218052B9|nr:ABC transporter substrate-binding protein [Paenibacillus doosanensis]MCS7459145.1 ABC transporter substrate-binding protein [Paenibacillus doosanensis]